MAKKKYMIFFIGVLLVISAGCSTKEVTQPDINKYDVGIEMDNKEQISEGAKKRLIILRQNLQKFRKPLAIRKNLKKCLVL